MSPVIQKCMEDGCNNELSRLLAINQRISSIMFLISRRLRSASARVFGRGLLPFYFLRIRVCSEMLLPFIDVGRIDSFIVSNDAWRRFSCRRDFVDCWWLGMLVFFFSWKK